MHEIFIGLEGSWIGDLHDAMSEMSVVIGFPAWHRQEAHGFWLSGRSPTWFAANV